MFARRFLNTFVLRAGGTPAHIPLFCMINYLSLYVHESRRALQSLEPQDAAALAVGNEQVIERSRNTIKFFDDNNPENGGVDGVARQFVNIIREHRAFFLNNTWFPPARVLETDLAVYHYRGRLISSTHAISFYGGLPPEVISDRVAMGQALRSLGESEGRYIASLTDTAPWQGSSFMDVLDLAQVSNKDRRAAQWYGQAFDACLSEEVTAALTAFQAALNFLDCIVSADPNPTSAEAVFKLKFITLYHVLSSLATFKTERGAGLSSGTAARLAAIVDDPSTAEVVRPNRRGLRNALIHYIPFTQLAPQLSLDLPLCGLVEAYCPGSSYADLSQTVNEHTSRVATLLDGWADGR
jgi:hypothetical protein